MPFNVPTSCGPRQTQTSGCTVIGANARPVQVIATTPAGPANRGDFAAVGVYAGCANGNCTGGALGQNFNRRVYADGSDALGYYLVMSGAGPNGRLEVRNLVNVVSGANTWRAYNNGVLVNARSGDFFNGFTSYGSESATPNGGGPLNMDYLWAGVERRDSTNLWFAVSEAAQVEPHAPACVIQSVTPGTGFGTLVEVDGSC